MMDGTDNNYVGIGGAPSVIPQIDIIEEFRVSTNNFSSEYRRNAGAIVNILTKSGPFPVMNETRNQWSERCAEAGPLQ